MSSETSEILKHRRQLEIAGLRPLEVNEGCSESALETCITAEPPAFQSRGRGRCLPTGLGIAKQHKRNARSPETAAWDAARRHGATPCNVPEDLPGERAMGSDSMDLEQMGSVNSSRSPSLLGLLFFPPGIF